MQIFELLSFRGTRFICFKKLWLTNVSLTLWSLSRARRKDWGGKEWDEKKRVNSVWKKIRVLKFLNFFLVFHSSHMSRRELPTYSRVCITHQNSWELKFLQKRVHFQVAYWKESVSYKISRVILRKLQYSPWLWTLNITFCAINKGPSEDS